MAAAARSSDNSASVRPSRPPRTSSVCSPDEICGIGVAGEPAMQAFDPRSMIA